MGANTAYIASERGPEVPVLKLSYIGPPVFSDTNRYCYDKYNALWYRTASAWVQVTDGVSTTAPVGAADGYRYINPTTGARYIYDESEETWDALATAVPDFVPDADGDPGVHGLVPASAAGDAAASKVLLATGAWGNVALSDVTKDSAAEVADDATVAQVVTALKVMGLFTTPT